MKIVESPFFRARKTHLSSEEENSLDREIQKIKEHPQKGIHRPKIRPDLYSHIYEDSAGKKILSYRFQLQKISLVSIDRLTVKI